ncbi:MAG: FapA family protein [Spirochaetaceae bacterium]|nr:FapA family protein [Spirochaetaceae bacterium]
MDFIELQEKMKERLEEDRSVNTIEAEGPSLETAVAEAAALLDVPVRRLEYELVERGFPGFLGTGKKPWKIRAYERSGTEEAGEDEDFFAEEFGSEEPVIVDRDGQCFVLLTANGVMLKVTLPEGNGRRVSESQTLKTINARPVKNLDTEMVSRAVQGAAGIYIKIADFDQNPANDTAVTVELDEQEMRAWIRVTPPGPGGRDLTAEEYLSEIKSSRVYFGLKEDAVTAFADKPVYREAFLVAEGQRPVHGRDAYIQYNFETQPNRVRMREGVNGRVDFKQLNIIQNVVQDYVLARKIPAEAGVEGKSITAERRPANDGKDISLPLGKNVHVAEDGVTILSDINGQVLLVDGKINVEPTYLVEGNVGLKTGNIDFLGNVMVTGNVEDGFFIKAAGNIEINGMVERASLEARGDILIHQGIAGKGSGVIRTERSIWAKFIENSNVTSGSMVVVNDGIVNSRVDAFGRVVVRGKRANIVGGRIRATQEITAKAIGSPTSGTETVCEVGYDLRAKIRFDRLSEEKKTAEEELEELERNLQTLLNIKKQRKNLPEEEEKQLREMTENRQSLLRALQEKNNELAKLKEVLATSLVPGRVSASDRVYPGVKIAIRDAREDVKSDYKAVTFVLEDGLIRARNYEEPEGDDELGRALDADTAN